MNAKTDCLGNPVLRDGTKVVVFNKETGKVKSITCYKSEESAKNEFNRLTCSYRGCGRNVYMFHPQARVYYGQLIIRI